jgi:protein-disulfide isomerase
MTTKENNNVIIYAIIWVLIALVAGMGGFILSDKMWGTSTWTDTPQTNEPITVTLYSDKRCRNCNNEDFLAQLKGLPFLGNAQFEVKDFADAGVDEVLKKNNIKALPAIVFPTNKLPDSEFTKFLVPLPDGTFSLNVGATFDPYVKRSEKGFMVLEKATLDEIKADSYVKGNANAKITWLEYSDLECPFCAKLHNSGTPEEIEAKYGDTLNKMFNHFPLDFHPNAKPAAMIAECLAEAKWIDAFYALIHESFVKENSSKSFLLDEAVKLWGDEAALEKCLDDKKYASKIDAQMGRAQKLFGINGTPGNVLINNETGEYDVISGAYPTQSFVDIIDGLLK